MPQNTPSLGPHGFPTPEKRRRSSAASYKSADWELAPAYEEELEEGFYTPSRIETPDPWSRQVTPSTPDADDAPSTPLPRPPLAALFSTTTPPKQALVRASTPPPVVLLGDSLPADNGHPSGVGACKRTHRQKTPSKEPEVENNKQDKAQEEREDLGDEDADNEKSCGILNGLSIVGSAAPTAATRPSTPIHVDGCRPSSAARRPLSAAQATHPRVSGCRTEAPVRAKYGKPRFQGPCVNCVYMGEVNGNLGMISLPSTIPRCVGRRKSGEHTFAYEARQPGVSTHTAASRAVRRISQLHSSRFVCHNMPGRPPLRGGIVCHNMPRRPTLRGGRVMRQQAGTCDEEDGGRDEYADFGEDFPPALPAMSMQQHASRAYATSPEPPSPCEPLANSPCGALCPPPSTAGFDADRRRHMQPEMQPRQPVAWPRPNSARTPRLKKAADLGKSQVPAHDSFVRMQVSAAECLSGAAAFSDVLTPPQLDTVSIAAAAMAPTKFTSRPTTPNLGIRRHAREDPAYV
eukprot:gnl/TRDRNA2_/TRDRNA2_131197_c0_seq1.p1 gnl/TRDRNA2_/TRDRNA2_131197_c0~~gnl/TRDRNA2_/TRDRNA2_131197_c0_seq1.p1  ORF type:complete len:518 (+),score=68.27 gnl/TRDRNA2_/TRDRNA2_131197_c0_seq1:30-1583(+)